MTSPKVFYDEEKKENSLEPSAPLENNAMYFPGGGRITPVKGVFFGDSEIGTRKLVPRDGSDIQKAIDNLNFAGGGVVFLKNGTYKMSTSIALYSNIYLEGENADSTIIDFQDNSKSILVQGTNSYSAGTLSVTNNSTSVTGSSTSWDTNVVAGMYILLGGIWYPIATVGGATSITLGIPYAGVTLSAGTTYTIAAIINDAKVLNLTIKNAYDGINIQYANEIVIRDVNIQASVTAITASASSQIQYDQVDMVANNAGLSMTNVHFTKAGELGVIDALAGNGITLNTVTNSSFQSCFVQNSSADGINLTSCSNLNIFGSFVENGGQGMELVSGNSDIALMGGAYENNGSDGIKLTATTDNLQIIGNSIKDNGGYGVNVAASTDDGNNITGNNFSGNSSGTVNDSGTGTMIRGNIGVDDNGTGAQAITQITSSFIAAESLSSGDAVYLIEGQNTTPTSIATDATSSAQQASGTSVTVSHTCTGNNRILIGGLMIINSGVSNVAMTYNGVSMTQIGTKTVGGAANADVYLFYLVNPASGANTLSATWSGTSAADLFGSSYTGASMVSQPDSSATGNATDGSTHISVATTVVASNCWLVGIYRMDSNNSTTYDSGTTARVVYQPSAFQGQGILDSNGTVSAGSQSLGVSVNEASIVGAMVVAAILPFQGTVAKTYANVTGKYNTFVGFANAAASVGATVSVVVSGAKTGLSGLTPGSLYYLSDTAGAISSSAGTNTRKVGIAISTTELLITNLW